jgi:GNAT superfamily N-acetyltransferase
MSLVVRKSLESDFADVFDLLAQLWPEKALLDNAVAASRMKQAFHNGLESEREIYITALLYKRIVGFASISIETSLYHGGQLAWVEALVSDKNVHSQGIGSALMTRVIEEAMQSDCKAVEIMIDHQAHAVKFVKSKGFELRGNAFELKLL